jgi:hypothetical protein
MHINVRDFLAESVGFSRAYKISGERPALATVVLTHDVEGDVTIARLEDEIDLAPLMEQEIILSLPIKILDRPDCPGIEGVSEEFTDDNPGTSLKDRAHITKGT